MEENDVRRAYMHAAEFWSERVEMMQVWADHLDQLRSVRGLSRLKQGFDSPWERQWLRCPLISKEFLAKVAN